MKKLFYWVGAFVVIGAAFAAVAVMLKKLKISLSIEGISDDIEGEEVNEDIDLSIEGEEEYDFDETADAVEEALEEMLSEDENSEIEVEITKE